MRSPASRPPFYRPKKPFEYTRAPTVATVTEIYDYLRVLYARAGQPYCIHHDVPIVRLSKEEMIKMVL